MNRELAKGWVGFYQFVMEIKAAKDKMRRAIGYGLNRALAGGFNKWQYSGVPGGMKAALHWRNTALSGLWARWVARHPVHVWDNWRAQLAGNSALEGGIRRGFRVWRERVLADISEALNNKSRRTMLDATARMHAGFKLAKGGLLQWVAHYRAELRVQAR